MKTLLNIVVSFSVIFMFIMSILMIKAYKTLNKLDKFYQAQYEIQRLDDICHISSIIHAECSTCTEEEKYLVGSVVLNRAQFRKKTIEEVLAEENQFYGFKGDNYYPTPENNSIAADLLDGKNRDNRFLYFFSGDPCWSVKLVNVKRKSWHHTFSF